MTSSACHFVIRHVSCFYVCESRSSKGKAALAQNKKESAEALPGEDKEEAIALSAPEPKPEHMPEFKSEPKPESMPEAVEAGKEPEAILLSAIMPEPEASVAAESDEGKKTEEKTDTKTPEVIELSAPAAPVISPAIAPAEPEDSASGTVIELGAPPASSGTDSDSGHSDV